MVNLSYHYLYKASDKLEATMKPSEVDESDLEGSPVIVAYSTKDDAIFAALRATLDKHYGIVDMKYSGSELYIGMTKESPPLSRSLLEHIKLYLYTFAMITEDKWAHTVKPEEGRDFWTTTNTIYSPAMKSYMHMHRWLADKKVVINHPRYSPNEHPSANVIIYGEIHSNPESVRSIQQAIRKQKPDYILHELLYNDVVSTPEDIRQRLKDCKEGGDYCDPTLNKDVYELGLELGAKLVGIDLAEVDKRDPLKIQFQKREKRMVEVIRKYIGYKVAVVVGDTHLRTVHTNELGAKSLIQFGFFGEPRVKIIRAPKEIQEVK